MIILQGFYVKLNGRVERWVLGALEHVSILINNLGKILENKGFENIVIEFTYSTKIGGLANALVVSNQDSGWSSQAGKMDQKPARWINFSKDNGKVLY